MKNKIKKSSLLLLGIILGLTVLTAQEKSNSMLWKVEGNGLEAPSYLFGTIHILCEDDFEMKDKVVAALKDADKLVMELDYSNTQEMSSMQQSALGEKKISETLNEDQLKELDALLLAKLGMGVAVVDQYSLMTVNALLLLKGIGCQNPKMFEFELAALAGEESKSIGGLESVSEQISMFNKAYPIDFMFDQLILIDEYIDAFDDMVASYKMEDAEAVQAQLMDERFMNENSTKYILNERNMNWADRIPEMMEMQSNFFAVGAAHLPGEQGLITLLQKKGYTVSPVL
jgi:uncharacterized protein